MNRDEPLGVFKGAGIVANLLAGFDKRAIDRRAARGIRKLPQVSLQISHERGAVVVCRRERILQRRIGVCGFPGGIIWRGFRRWRRKAGVLRRNRVARDKEGRNTEDGAETTYGPIGNQTGHPQWRTPGFPEESARFSRSER